MVMGLTATPPLLETTVTADGKPAVVLTVVATPAVRLVENVVTQT
jgi:hypothetical protein